MRPPVIICIIAWVNPLFMFRDVDMTIQNGAVYDNNYGRAAAYFLATCAPAPEDGARLEAYRLITGIYAAVLRDADALGYKPSPDVFFSPWEQQKGREKDIRSIRGAIDKVEGLIADLFAITESAEIVDGHALLPPGTAPGRTLKKALGAVGITAEKADGRVRLPAPAGCFAGLKELAAISRTHVIPITDGPQEDKPYLYFSRCVFKPEENWAAMAFDKLLGAEGRLVRLCAALEKRGYRRLDCVDGKKISLDYVMQHGKQAEPVKWAWGERTHSGISVTYEELRLEPCFLWLRMPMFKTVLQNAEKFPPGVAAFIAAHTKTCDGCRYCVQTDKTHTRPLACVKLGDSSKCPLFPGFTMNWRALPAGLDESILALLDALNGLPELR